MTLHASYVLEYEYKRSLGPALSAFFTGLRDQRILGVQCADGSVTVPPAEYDAAGAPAGVFVEVGPEGIVETAAWVESPLPSHPSRVPFAFALIRLDGATSCFAHIVCGDGPGGVRAGVRVRPRWAETRGLGILDIQYFEPVPG